MFLNRLILQYQAWICPQPPVQAQVTLLHDWTCHFHASFPPMNEDECFICSADRVNMWTTYQEEADEDRGRDRGHSGVPPLGRRHILARQVQGEGVPLWGQSDFILLGSHSSPLLSWRVGTHTTYWIQRVWDLILNQSQGCIGTSSTAGPFQLYLHFHCQRLAKLLRSAAPLDDRGLHTHPYIFIFVGTLREIIQLTPTILASPWP